MSVSQMLVSHMDIPPEVQLILAARPGYENALVQNKHLSDEVFTSLYKKGMPVAQARFFCFRQLSPVQLDHVLVTVGEHRAEPLMGVLHHNNLSSEDKQKVAALPLAKTIANELLKDPDTSLEVKLQVLPRASTRTLLAWLEVNHTSVTNDEVLVDLLEAAVQDMNPGDIPDKACVQLRSIAAQRPKVASRLAARAKDMMSVALVLSPLRLTKPDLCLVLDSLCSLETPGWNRKAFSCAALSLKDRLDLPEDDRRRVTRVLERLLGSMAVVNSGAGRHNSTTWRELELCDDLSTVSDPALLDSYLFNRSMNMHDMYGKTIGVRECSWYYLAFNQHLSTRQVNRLVDILKTSVMRENLGRVLRREALESLQALYPGLSIRKPPKVQGPKPKASKGASSPTPEVNEAPVPLRSVASWSVELLNPRRAIQVSRFLHDRLGDNASAWEIFLGLADSFSGTVSRLTSTALALSEQHIKA